MRDCWLRVALFTLIAVSQTTTTTTMMYGRCDLVWSSATNILKVSHVNRLPCYGALEIIVVLLCLAQGGIKR